MNDLPFDAPEAAPDFDGETYERERDRVRLAAQALKVWKAIRDQGWFTLHEIEQKTGAPQASISARLRDFRKPRFGGHKIERRFVGNGLFEYRLVVNEVGLDCLIFNEDE